MALAAVAAASALLWIVVMIVAVVVMVVVMMMVMVVLSRFGSHGSDLGLDAKQQVEAFLAAMAIDLPHQSVQFTIHIHNKNHAHVTRH